MGQKGADVRVVHVGRVFPVVKKDVALDPVDIGLFRPDAVMLAAKGIAHLIQQLRFGRRRSDTGGQKRAIVLAGVKMLIHLMTSKLTKRLKKTTITLT
jgi:hypothetical protein